MNDKSREDISEKFCGIIDPDLIWYCCTSRFSTQWRLKRRSETSPKRSSPALSMSMLCRLGGMCFSATAFRYTSVLARYLWTHNTITEHTATDTKHTDTLLSVGPDAHSLAKANSSGERNEGSPSARDFSFSKTWGKNFSIWSREIKKKTKWKYTSSSFCDSQMHTNLQVQKFPPLLHL